jgi:hypothetical protein
MKKQPNNAIKKCLALYGSLWLFMALYGSLWLFMALYGSLSLRFGFII